ncbi:MAG: GYF domain-containing protein [Verrucomicrobiota bacterium]
MITESNYYYLIIDEKAEGPLKKEVVSTMLMNKQISHDTFCCPVGDSQWGTVREYFPPDASDSMSSIASMHTVKLQLPARSK